MSHRRAQGVNFPSWVYHATKGSRLVQSRSAFEALGPGWWDSPARVHEPDDLIVDPPVSADPDPVAPTSPPPVVAEPEPWVPPAPITPDPFASAVPDAVIRRPRGRPRKVQ
jgi:hypothetical protein